MIRNFLYSILLTLVVCSCGVDGKHFKLEGRLLHLNQGEFYVYSTDGLLNGIDTVKIVGGRFAYEIPCTEQGTLVIVFPNFYEQPVFAAPGKSVNMTGDASLLRELETEGTKDNELMTAFRKQVSGLSPQQTTAAAAAFVRKNADSEAALWIVRKYFVATPSPDYAQARKLLATLHDRQPRNGNVARLAQQVNELTATAIGATLPKFSCTDTSGKTISSNEITKAYVGVVYLWASWNYESTEMQRRLRLMKDKAGGKLSIIGISADAAPASCKTFLERDSVRWSTVCDGMMFESKTVRALGLYGIPSNILLKNGKIIDRDLSTSELMRRLEELL